MLTRKIYQRSVDLLTRLASHNIWYIGSIDFSLGSRKWSTCSLPAHFHNDPMHILSPTARTRTRNTCDIYFSLKYISSSKVEISIDCIDSALFKINRKTAQIMWCDEINSWNKNEWPMPPWSSFGHCIYVWRLLLRSLSHVDTSQAECHFSITLMLCAELTKGDSGLGILDAGVSLCGWVHRIPRGYPAKRALSGMRKHGRWGPFGRIPLTCAQRGIAIKSFENLLKSIWLRLFCLRYHLQPDHQ